MKQKNILILFLFGVLACFQTSCSDWTEVEHENIDKLLVGADSAMVDAHNKYLENLRAYKSPTILLLLDGSLHGRQTGRVLHFFHNFPTAPIWWLYGEKAFGLIRHRKCWRI